MEQGKIFKQTEGDNWFRRNRGMFNRERLKTDVVLGIIRLFDIQPKRVLELGCVNGYRLSYLGDEYNCECAGIDCSRMAIEDGQRRYKGIRLICGGVDKLCFKDSCFDLVIINFVFHWLDRKTLSSVVSEADRVVKNKGLIIVGDFYPLFPIKKAYHHLEDKKVYTYKDDYSKLFERLGYYQNVGRIVGECGTRRICVDAKYDNRFKVDLLLKDSLMRKGMK